MRPRRSFPPDEFCRGVSPSQAENSRLDLKCEGSVTVVAMAVAVINPTPGIVSNRRLSWLVRCQARSFFSIVLICNLSSISCATRGRRAVRGKIKDILGENALDQFAHMSDALRDHDPELGKMRPKRVCQHRLLPDQERPRAMKHKSSLLVGTFDRDKPHVRPGHRLANRLRIRGVVLPTLDIRLHVSRWHQLYTMPEPCEFACPIMRGRAGFHPDQAGFKSRKEGKHLRPSETFADNRLAFRIDTVNLNHSLGEINPDCANLHGGRPLSQCGALYDDHAMAPRCR